MKTLLHPTYFPNIAHFTALVQNDVIWEVSDNYQKQTYRNRCYICNDRGQHTLSIPIIHKGKKAGRQKSKEVRIDNSYPWQRQHWRTLETAYRTSPYFEFYEDDIKPLFEKEHEFLLDFNLRTAEIICEGLQVEMPTEKTTAYNVTPSDVFNGRKLAVPRFESGLIQEEYTQVFNDRHGFIKNTSTLDLLFNEGPNGASYLSNQKLSLF